MRGPRGPAAAKIDTSLFVVAHAPGLQDGGIASGTYIQCAATQDNGEREDRICPNLSPYIAKCRHDAITYNVSDKLKADLGKLMNLCESTHKRFIREIAVKKVMEHAEKEVAAANAFLEIAREAVLEAENEEAENEQDTPTTQDEGEGARPDDWIPDGAMVPVPAEPLGPLR